MLGSNEDYFELELKFAGPFVLPCVLDPYLSDDADIYMCPWSLPDEHMANLWQGQDSVCLTHPSENVIIQMNKKFKCFMQEAVLE